MLYDRYCLHQANHLSIVTTYLPSVKFALYGCHTISPKIIKQSQSLCIFFPSFTSAISCWGAGHAAEEINIACSLKYIHTRRWFDAWTIIPWAVGWTQPLVETNYSTKTAALHRPVRKTLTTSIDGYQVSKKIQEREGAETHVGEVVGLYSNESRQDEKHPDKTLMRCWENMHRTASKYSHALLTSQTCGLIMMSDAPSDDRIWSSSLLLALWYTSVHCGIMHASKSLHHFQCRRTSNYWNSLILNHHNLNFYLAFVR